MVPIISVRGLGKRYRIADQRAPYSTLRESIMRGLRGSLRRRSTTAGDRTFWALRDVTVDIAPGEVVGVIGRNGAGKSTLLKVLSRITEPTEGEVDLYGRVGCLLEVGTGFHSELTGRDNIFLSGAVLGMRRAEIIRKFDEIVAFAEVAAFLDTPINHYSGGMTMRLAFSSPAHPDPEILFGFPKGSFGQELRIVRAVHDQDRLAVEAATTSALETGTYETEYRAVRPDGHVVWITERGRVFSDADGDRMVGISRDVTAERESAREREHLLKSEREARDEAERQSRLKDEFLATLSHELRTPMNVILGWLDTLTKGKAIRDTRSALAIVQRNAETQAKLIEDLLDMNRLLSGNLRVELVPVDVGVTAQTAIQGLQPAADAKGVELNCVVDAQEIGVLADSRRLQQVLWNLVHNAIKFTPRGGRVDVRVAQLDGYANIVVQDNGNGIHGEFLPHVFERFRQQDSSTTRESPGLGLGLSIAKHLVELHGGTISAFSDGDGAGAKFVVELPAVDKTTEEAVSVGANPSGDLRDRGRPVP